MIAYPARGVTFRSCRTARSGDSATDRARRSGRWRTTAEHLYREVARIIEAQAVRMLVSGCGDGLTVEWLAARTKASVTGVDSDAKQIERAEARLRGASSSRTGTLQVSFQQAALDDLPHEDGVFDAVVGEPAIAAARTRPARLRS